MPACVLDCAEMAADAPGPLRAAPERHEAGDENDGHSWPEWLASLYHLHGPPGPPPASTSLRCPTHPFVEPRTAPFSVRLSARNLSSLLDRCASSGAACPWQDVCEDGAGRDVDDVPEHKWVIYAVAEEDGAVKLQMHRSWTGIKLIELTLDAPVFRPPLEDATLEDVVLEDHGARNTDAKGGGVGVDGGPSITHITFETHADYRLKDADEGLYKSVARDVCWWALGVFLGPETKV